MTSVQLHSGDCRQSLQHLIDQGVRVHSVVTDPPYHLESIVKRFGRDGSAAAKFGSDGAFARASSGFMSRRWDGADENGVRIAQDPEFWRLIWEILLPGGFVFAFSGSRTGHWQACAMEMAGFVMHPMHGWAYGSGFPKAHNPVKHIDALALRGSATTSDIRQMEMGGDYEPSGRGRVDYDNGGGSKMNGSTGPYVAQTEEAQKWEGWRFGTQSQKPALEPIYLGQRPFSEKNGALNLMKHGVGAVNIDGCRVATEENLGGGAYAQSGGRAMLDGDEREGASAGMFQPGKTAERDFVQPQGRWPANLLHDNSEEVVALFPDSKGQLARSSSSSSSPRAGQNTYGAMLRGSEEQQMEPRNDSGSAARFFNSFEPDCPPIIYHPKAGKADRAGSKHPTVKPIALLQHLVRHITPPGGVVLDPFAGSGTTAEAARREGFDCILMEAEDEYVDFLRKRFDLPFDLPPELLALLAPRASTPVEIAIEDLLA